CDDDLAVRRERRCAGRVDRAHVDRLRSAPGEARVRTSGVVEARHAEVGGPVAAARPPDDDKLAVGLREHSEGAILGASKVLEGPSAPAEARVEVSVRRVACEGEVPLVGPDDYEPALSVERAA